MSCPARVALERLGWRPAHLVVADGFLARLLGMAAMPAAAPDGLPYVLAFPRCRAVHTCFMRRALDVAFADGEGGVLALHGAVRPWRFLAHPDAVLVLERVAPGVREWDGARMRAAPSLRLDAGRASLVEKERVRAWAVVA